MIRLLTEKDHEACMKLIGEKPAENLFIIGDIEAYGYSQPFQKVWGEFSADGSLQAVLLKYEGNYLPYAPGEFQAEQFAEIMKSDPDWKMLSGLEEVTAKLEPFIKHKKKQQLYYASCSKLLSEGGTYQEVQKAALDDVEKILELMSAIPEFDSSEKAESKRRNMEKGTTRTYYIEKDGQMISSASTAAENTLSAMIVGVCTLEEYKQKGYATKIMGKLCSEVLSEGKELCLFYDNPKAGSIYKRLGFQDIGRWTMYSI